MVIQSGFVSGELFDSIFFLIQNLKRGKRKTPFIIFFMVQQMNVNHMTETNDIEHNDKIIQGTIN